MTKVESLEAELNTVRIVLSRLESRLITYRQREQNLQMKLNRARRLEREAKELR